jgi:hypothetical protein
VYLYPDNTWADFIVQLSQPIDLGTSHDWEVGVCEVPYRPPKRRIVSGTVVDTIGDANVLIYCDLIAPQFINNQIARVIRTIIYPTKLGDHCFTIFITYLSRKRCLLIYIL